MSLIVNYLTTKNSLERAKMVNFIRHDKFNHLSDLDFQEQRDEYSKLSESVVKNFYSNKFFSNCLEDVKKVKKSSESLLDEMQKYAREFSEEDSKHPETVLDTVRQEERKEKILSLFNKYSKDLNLIKGIENKLLQDESLEPHQKYVLNNLFSTTINSKSQLLSKKLETVKAKLEKKGSLSILNLKEVSGLLMEIRSSAQDASTELEGYVKETEDEIKRNKEYQKNLGDSFYDFVNRLNKLSNMKALLLANEKSKYAFFADMLSVATQRR